jgi:hypothetical protein
MAYVKHELKFIELARIGYYVVSENGEIFKTVCRSCNSKCFMKVKFCMDRGGYTRLKFNYEGKRYQILVHRVVYSFFNGEIPDGMQINHIDGDKKNNALSNLELVTPRENTLHAIYVTKKKKCFGLENLKRLKPVDISKVLYYRKRSGFTIKRLAERFDVSKSQIRRICKFTIWRDLLEKEDRNFYHRDTEKEKREIHT